LCDLQEKWLGLHATLGNHRSWGLASIHRHIYPANWHNGSLPSKGEHLALQTPGWLFCLPRQVLSRAPPGKLSWLPQYAKQTLFSAKARQNKHVHSDAKEYAVDASIVQLARSRGFHM
jgi:hypothetical protein